VLLGLAFAIGVFLGLRPLRRRSPEEPPAARDDASAAALPPAPHRAWTAEIEWRPAGDGARFRIVARAADGGGTAVLVESPALEWPPSGPEGVRALTAAADDLEARLVRAGWRPAAAGNAWYARRFAWEPSAPTRRSEREPAPPGRFARRAAWPEGSDELWRSEIEPDAGGGETRLRAVTRPPGDRRERPTGTASPERQLVPRTPVHHAEVSRLADALLAAGWERAGRGSSWYAERFVWRRQGAPPDDARSVSTHGGRAT
jgi:hypothetical protein